MVKTKFKKAVSLMLAAVMSLTAFTGIGATTAFAAVGEKADVYLVDYPRSGDTNNNGEWGHGNLNYMNGWKGLSTKYTGLRAMGSYSGNIAYCIEPGTGQRTGDTLTEKDENFFNNISPNGTISGDDIRLLIGRILQYGYRGGISTSWKSQNESDANCIAHAYATQILIWETIVGERDAGFNHVSTSGYNAVLECVSTAHPLRSKILSYYNSMVLNGNSFILGVSGGGKSFAAKGEIENIILSSNADVIIIDPEREYSQLVKALGGEIINISATSPSHINAMDMNKEYGDGANPVILKSEFIMSLCEQLIGGTNLGAKQKSIIDRCTASVYRDYQQRGYTGTVPTLQDFRAELLKQDEPEAKEIALAIELFTHGSLNTFAKPTNVDTDNRLICYDILDLGKQLMPIGMLVVLDSILNRITQNRAKGKQTFIFIDEIYLLFQHEYSANFLFTLWKRVRKYGAYATGITQNVDDLLQSHTARTMLANSEFLIMLNQASTDRIELAKLLNISDLQLSYITNVDAGHGLIKVGSSLVPFANKFPKNTKLYKLMTTKPGEGA